MASSMDCNPFCTIFSLGAPTPRGLFSLLPGLGIKTLLAGVKVSFPVLISLERFSNHSNVSPSKVSLVEPLLMFPGFPFISR